MSVTLDARSRICLGQTLRKQYEQAVYKLSDTSLSPRVHNMTSIGIMTDRVRHIPQV